MLDHHPQTVNFIMANWALELLSGNNCVGTTLRSTTIKEYLHAAQALLVEGGYQLRWKNKGLPLDDGNATMTGPVMANLKRWEAVPNRREMFSDSMHEEFYQIAKANGPYSMERAFYDWLALGRYTGFRLSEWAQTRKTSFEPINTENPDPKAMRDGDFLFFDKVGKLLDKTRNNYEKIYRLDVTWRHQKNGQHMEKISFWRDDMDSRWCPVRAAWRICMRARELNQDTSRPLGIYLDAKRRKVVYLNSTEVEKHIRQVAKKCTGITDDKVINKMFGLHSIRVTACNELARLGVPDSFIKRRLRWRSETFLDYLRNNVHTAQRHNLSLNIKAATQDKELQNNILLFQARTQRQ